MPSTENYPQSAVLSFLANTAVVKNLGGRLVAGRKVDEASTAGERIVGVIDDTETTAGNDIAVVGGPSFKLVTSGASFADLDGLAVDAAGKFRPATAGQVVVAYAMEAASAADQDKLAFILPMSQHRIPSAAIAALTHAFGTADGTVDDVGAAFNQATLNNNFKEVTAKLASIISALTAQGVTL